MKWMILLSLLFTTSVYAYNPMGGYFYNSRTKDKIVLTCINDEVAKDCEEAVFTLIKKDGTEEQLYDHATIPVYDTQEAFYERYHMFYFLRDQVIERTAYGLTAVFNSMRISKYFREAVKIMFTKKEVDFNKGIKVTNKNFKAMINRILVVF